MRIVLAGATGFLGGLLRERLRSSHELVLLTRTPRGTAGVTEVEWHPDGTPGPWTHALDGADAVINLAGEPLVGRRWSRARKAELAASRVIPTRSLVAAIDHATARPRVLISASAVGYYGPHGSEVLTEDAPAGQDFLASICVEWENAALAAEPLGTRVVTIRTGLVLSSKGGALTPMLLPFRLGLGGPIGSGRQYWPWIHADDWCGIVELLLDRPEISGAMNLTAPSPVTNAAFAKTLGHVLRRPAMLPAPRLALRAVLGEVADALLISGQRAEPTRALALGYTFAYENLETALRQILGA
jgi:uncharacterized protein (TIGR01777 family)